MAPALPRTSLNSSRLVRFLADLDTADSIESKQSFAERLSLWLDLTDAISLSAALKASAASGQDSSSGAPKSAIHEEFARVRSALIESIGPDDVLTAGNARLKFPVPAPGASIESAADFSPYHRYYLARQREMDAAIGPLRANVRAALAGAAPRLKQLAALDAVFEEALRPRERTLFLAVPLLLEKRFAQLRSAYLARLAESATADDPERWMQPGGWLAAFCKDMQSLLLAELELRLQPVTGMIEALGNEVTKNQ